MWRLLALGAQDRHWDRHCSLLHTLHSPQHSQLRRSKHKASLLVTLEQFNFRMKCWWILKVLMEGTKKNKRHNYRKYSPVKYAYPSTRIVVCCLLVILATQATALF
jgi:hypothetical protein